MTDQESHDPEDDQRRKFREALERKKTAVHDSHADGNPNKGVREVHNDKQQRQFRRKSG
jgi:hypothetical protein